MNNQDELINKFFFNYNKGWGSRNVIDVDVGSGQISKFMISDKLIEGTVYDVTQKYNACKNKKTFICAISSKELMTESCIGDSGLIMFSIEICHFE